MGYVWMSGQPACLSGHIAGGLLYTNGIYVRYYTALVPIVLKQIEFVKMISLNMIGVRNIGSFGHMPQI